MKTTMIYIHGTVVIIALAIGLLAGCGREKAIDYTIEGIGQEEQSGPEAGKGGLEQFGEAEVWVEEWTTDVDDVIEINGQIYKVCLSTRIDARVTVPGTTQMSVVEVKEPEFDAEYKRSLAEHLFEHGEIYYGDYSHFPKQDLEELNSRYAKGYRWHDNAIYSDVVVGRKRGDENDRKMAEALRNIENAGDTYTLVEEYTENSYIGYREGRLYNLDFVEAQGIRDYCYIKRIVWAVRNMEEVCPEMLKEQENWKEKLVVFPWTRGDWLENQCQISEEEARKEAERFVDGLGLDYSVQSATYPILWGEPPEVYEMMGDEKWYLDGYVFAYDLGMDGLSFVNYGREEDYENFPNLRGHEKYSLNACLQVYVTDKGVIKIVADNPMEIIGVSQNVGLLSLDNVKGIMKDALDNQREIFRLEYWSPDYNTMELIYFRVRDKGNPGKYSYVPAWRLAQVARDEGLNRVRIQYPVLINAMDGSVINLYDEI